MVTQWKGAKNWYGAVHLFWYSSQLVMMETLIIAYWTASLSPFSSEAMVDKDLGVSDQEESCQEELD